MVPALALCDAGTFLNDTQSPLQAVACRAAFDESKHLPVSALGFVSNVPILQLARRRQLSMHASALATSACADSAGTNR